MNPSRFHTRLIADRSECWDYNPADTRTARLAGHVSDLDICPDR